MTGRVGSPPRCLGFRWKLPRCRGVAQQLLEVVWLWALPRPRPTRVPTSQCSGKEHLRGGQGEQPTKRSSQSVLDWVGRWSEVTLDAGPGAGTELAQSTHKASWVTSELAMTGTSTPARLAGRWIRIANPVPQHVSSKNSLPWLYVQADPPHP